MLRRSAFALLTMLLLLALPLGAPLHPLSPAQAVEPSEMLDDPELEARARRISKNLRCLVCQNENIDESNAPLAKDLRILLRERLKAGDTDEQAIQYIVDRYGEYVLLKPRFAAHTLILWIGPFVILALGLLSFWHYRRRVQTSREAAQVEAPLSEEEKKRLEELLKS